MFKNIFWRLHHRTPFLLRVVGGGGGGGVAQDAEPADGPRDASGESPAVEPRRSDAASHTYEESAPRSSAHEPNQFWRIAMRTMMKISIPAASGNKAIQDGSLPRIVQDTLEALKAEAAYFTAEGGKRTAFIFFDLKDSSQMPVVAEPFFMGLDAEVEIIPAMNAQDLQTGLSQLARK
jgi:hypothetical protein